MFVALKHGIRYSGMGGWRDLTSDRQIWQIVTFLDRIEPVAADVGAAWKVASATTGLTLLLLRV